MEKRTTPTPDAKTDQQELSRRQILKILGTSGGALAASAFLPNTWLSPMVEIGVLPAHAQATGEITISDLEYTRGGLHDTQDAINERLAIARPYYGGVGFSDPTAMLNNTNCLINMTYQGSSYVGLSVLNWAVYYKASYSGTVNWSFSAPTDLCEKEVCTQIENEDTAQTSNRLCGQMPECPVL